VKKTLLSTLVVAMLLGGSGACLAQAPAGGLKPLVTVSFSGYNELLSDVEFLGNLGGNPEVGKALEGFLVLATQGKGLAGLDKSKPWAVLVQTDGMQFPAVGYVPVTDLSQLLDVLTGMGITSEDTGDGTFQLETEGPPLFVKEQGGWAMVSNTAETLAGAPADPLQSLGGLEKKYDLAVRASVKNIPPMMRQRGASILKDLAKLLPQWLLGVNGANDALGTGASEKAVDQLLSEVDDLDEVLIGWALDQSTGTTFLDLEVTAVEGTKTAAQFAQIAEMATNFAGFDLPGAAVTGNWANTLSDAEVAQMKSRIAAYRAAALKYVEDEDLSAAEVEQAKQLIGDLLDVAEKTVETKEGHGGVVMMLDPDAVTFVTGGNLAEGAKLEGVIKQLYQLASKDSPELAQLVKLDAETHAGIRLHTVAIPMPPDQEEAVKLFGPTLNVVLGISETSIYLAGGSDAMATLKQVIDKSQAEAGKQIPPIRIAVAATPIAKFVAANAPDEGAKMMATMLAGQLEQSVGKDQLTITGKPIPGGASIRLELEEGVLKLIAEVGKIVQQQLMGGGGPPGGAPF